ncbi:unnamed protein product [Paramecium sonneborni]|uniref:Transmembrane protein n=1 Tax=Paramecium sonneborni TaxID=65129 RepID=A0A8S1R6W2_9CILI|nr:unnamed protein product [Paramecium sonneborni]
MNSNPEKNLKRKQKSANIVQKKRSTRTAEITAEFFKRQREYDNINKYSMEEQDKDQMKLSIHKSNFHSLKDAVKRAKLKFFESTPQWKNVMNSSIPSYQQQYNSIIQIANHFRNQKKNNNCSIENEKKQPQKQWNLRLILIIVVPIICIIRVLFAFILTQ